MCLESAGAFLNGTRSPRVLGVCFALACLMAGPAAAQGPLVNPPPEVAGKLAAALREDGLGRLLEEHPAWEAVGQGYAVNIGPYRYLFSRDGAVSSRGARLDGLVDQERIRRVRRETLAGLDPADMVIFPAHQPRYILTVFSDVTCPFSAALHRDIDLITGAGIEVRYLAFPRHGIGSLGHKKMEAVWCNADRQAAFDQAMQGRRVKLPACAAPVERQYRLGEALGVPGTPTLILQDGEMIAGYDGDIAALLDLLEQRIVQ